MMWIHATPEQRDRIVASAEQRNEAKRCTRQYQDWLAGEIAELVDRRSAKVAELEAGGFARRLNRQIAELDREIEELKPFIRKI